MRILHPTDFSQPAQLALALARDLRRRSNGSLHVVHVQQRFESDSTRLRSQLDSLNPELSRRADEDRNLEVERLRGMLSHVSSPDATSELLWGNPVEELLAMQERFDMVVMGAHGASRFDKVFLGGVAGRFVRRAHVPVITVRDEATVGQLQRVLVATDFGEPSAAAWELVRSWAPWGVEVVLTHVIDDERLKDDADHMHEVTTQMSDLSQGVASRLVVRSGNPVTVVPQIAQEVGADLIAIGLRHHSAAAGLLLGSRADALIRSSSVPILSVPVTVP
ncbi:MAG: universal stress protein [Trueperaceae bacterium]|jgi:nucleotide-binding universal stress UspA family protein|nr:universal stress protein [Truepera sp.]HRN17534.1 universal stress protein [Trueperaceae bacterium]HRQ11044.1 universal stress protein [Trueperaceae bacterium]